MPHARVSEPFKEATGHGASPDHMRLKGPPASGALRLSANCAPLAGWVRHPLSSASGNPVRRWWPSSRSEEHTSELQSLMRISYAVFCLKKKKNTTTVKKLSEQLVRSSHNTRTNAKDENA